MPDHVTITVTDLEKARRFYDAALAPPGIHRVYDGEENFPGYGTPDQAFFRTGFRSAQSLTGTHVAFTAGSRSEVDSFYAAAIAAGGIDNGAPGLRPHYHDDDYGAFVRRF